MAELTVKPVTSAIEFAKAYELALSVFSENSSDDYYAEHKKNNWVNDPSFSYENILLASCGNEYAGLIRIVPRVLFRDNQSFSVAGISSVCLAPSFRGRGLSVPLMNQSLAFCKERNFDIAFLFARRAADHYYTQFGFYGVAAYARVFVKYQGRKKSGRTFSLSPLNNRFAELYSRAYDYSYHSCFGRMERTAAYWLFLLNSFQTRTDCRFCTIEEDGLPIGYLVFTNKKIVEISLVKNNSGKELIGFLLSQGLFETQTDILEIEILPQHRLIEQLKGTDITFQFRECSYGGHMLKVINKNKMIDISADSVDENTYEDTCRMMGILSPTSFHNFQNGAVPFDIGYLDQF